MALRRGQRLGQYRIEGRLANGGFAVVYKAMDSVEGIRVALKVPHDHLVTEETLRDFRKEVRLCAPLDHQNVLPIKTAYGTPETDPAMRSEVPVPGHVTDFAGANGALVRYLE